MTSDLVYGRTASSREQSTERAANYWNTFSIFTIYAHLEKFIKTLHTYSQSHEGLSYGGHRPIAISDSKGELYHVHKGHHTYISHIISHHTNWELAFLMDAIQQHCPFQSLTIRIIFVLHHSISRMLSILYPDNALRMMQDKNYSDGKRLKW